MLRRIRHATTIRSPAHESRPAVARRFLYAVSATVVVVGGTQDFLELLCDS